MTSASVSSAIHPTAVVDPGAELGQGVAVGPYTVIGAGVRIGDGTVIGPHVVVEGNTELGSECRVFQFASVGSAPQDLKYHGEPSTLVIGTRNIIREYVTLQPGTEGGGMRTIVGDGNLFMACSHVGHDCVIGSHNIFANSVGLAGHVTIEDRVILGGLVGVHQFCRVGSFAMLSGGAMVAQDVPPYCLGQGDRCRLRGINIVGLKRAGFDDASVSDIKKVYRQLFSGSGGARDKASAMPAEFAERPHVKRLLDFVLASTRGICPAGSGSAE